MRLGPFQKSRGEAFALVERVFPAIEVARTPCETIDTDDRTGFSLIRYGGSGDGRAPLLFVPHIVNRPYILDLNDDVSVVRALLRKGFDVYLIDWGYPTIEDRNVSFSDYVAFVRHAVDIIAKDKVSILGYCTGGLVSLMFASLHPNLVQSLCLLATPVDFSGWHDPRLLWGKTFDARSASAIFGNIPGEMVNLIGFNLLWWHMPLFRRSREFVEEMQAPEARRDMWRRIRWIVDAQAVPGRAFTEFVDGCYKQNLLFENRFQVGESLVNLIELKCPVLNIIARHDHIVPPQSASALKDACASRDYEEISFPSSHVGLAASHRAHRELWPRVADWLHDRSTNHETAPRQAGRRIQPRSKSQKGGSDGRESN